ncbi:hypothetical protein IW261DRAFT_1422849 [Armillaria novae-zelandiae]|uniref:Uncharacterized protein n=1 Tax=Armillaria novae-zelandiae TaxID=153914 RepID=A0AA39NZ39_9AGAR|nr:hypothetical protein IW261DRAFT_1422849 [Armillaria novae-zelandiae]
MSTTQGAWWRASQVSQLASLLHWLKDVDFVRLYADLAPPHWSPHSVPDKWDAGYQHTACFLDWLETRYEEGTGWELKVLIKEQPECPPPRSTDCPHQEGVFIIPSSQPNLWACAWGITLCKSNRDIASHNEHNSPESFWQLPSDVEYIWWSRAMGSENNKREQ